MSVTFCRTAGPGPAARATVREGAGLDEAAIAAALAEGLLPVETARAGGPALAFVAGPADALALAGAGVGGWRITVRHEGPRAAVLDALVRSGAAFLRTDPARLEEAIELGWLPGTAVRVSVPVADLAEALDAIAAGAVDLVLGDWGPDEVAALRAALAPRALVERTALPPETEIDAARADLARPLFTAWLARVDGSGAARPRYRWAPGRDEAPPVPARRLSAEWEDAAWREGEPEAGLGRLAPDLAGILERSLEGRPPRVDEIERLFRARGPEVEAVAQVADRLRARALRRGRHLRRQPQHQLHQPVLLPLRLLRLLARAQEPQPARRPLHPRGPRGRAPLGRGLGARRHRGLPAGRHPPRLHRRLLRRRARGDQGAPARDARPRLHAARGLAGRPHARGERARVPHPPARRRPGHAAGHRRRDPRRPRAPAPVPGQGAHRRVGRGHDHRPRARPARHHHDDVRPHRRAARLGQPPRGAAPIQRRTGGFTEFVPLPFVHMASPIFLQGRARPGPTWDEVVLVHAVGPHRPRRA